MASSNTTHGALYRMAFGDKGLTPADLPADKIAALRQYIHENQGQYGITALDAQIRKKYGVSATQVLEPNAEDFWRAAAQGASLGHADELQGLATKLSGGDYATGRDAIRQQDAQFSQDHGLLNAATQGVAGGIPGLAVAPLAGIQKGAMLANVLKGAGTGAALGGIAGEGNSNAPTTGGVMQDAGMGAGVGGAVGAAGGYLGSKLASLGNPLSNTNPVTASAGATLSASDPQELASTFARQEQLAPGTAVLADASPQMQKFVTAIGADRKTAMLSTEASRARVAAIDRAREVVGKQYDVLADMKRPVDDQLRAAMQQAGRSSALPRAVVPKPSGLLDASGTPIPAPPPPQPKIPLAAIHEARTDLLRQARTASDPGMQYRYSQAAAQLTDWLTRDDNAPFIKQVDSDYAFLRDRLGVAEDTHQAVANSLGNYEKARAAGLTPTSVGGSLTTPVRQVGTKIVEMVTQPQRAARARAISQLMLSPQRDPAGLARLSLVHDALLQSQSAPLAGSVKNAVVGAGIQGFGALPQ